jgi:hypothetical protein
MDNPPSFLRFQFFGHTGAGDADRFRKQAAELVALAPDVVLASSLPVVGPLLQATRGPAQASESGAHPCCGTPPDGVKSTSSWPPDSRRGAESIALHDHKGDMITLVEVRVAKDAQADISKCLQKDQPL